MLTQRCSLDLPFAQPLDSVVPASDGASGASAPMHVYGAVQRATLAGADKVTMRFASNSTSIAAAERKVGDGHTVWCGFLPVSKQRSLNRGRKPQSSCLQCRRSAISSRLCHAGRSTATCVTTPVRLDRQAGLGLRARVRVSLTRTASPPQTPTSCRRSSTPRRWRSSSA